MAHKQIYYSDKYFDDQYEYRYEAMGRGREGRLKALRRGSCRPLRGGLGRRLSRGCCHVLREQAPPVAAARVTLASVGPEGAEK
uniref:Uncharacterized protein n=1 Tax=Otus sunia TaxID=257818 RepID=A0A8C8AIG2_9STRI